MKREERMSDNDIPDWLKALIVLGLGAFAIYMLSEIAKGAAGSPPDKCPHCGAPIQKWARNCPRCRKPLVWG
jgi:hypothetical protein